MVEVRYTNPRSQEQRIADRLRCSSPDSAKRPQDHQRSNASAETHPTRTITHTYFPGSATLHGRPKHSGD
jgi:hypothetical protein